MAGMNLDQPASPEKEPARWERITGKEDRADLTSYFRVSEDFDFSALKGLLLRRGTKIVGFAHYMIEESPEEGRVLYILDMEIDRRERSGGVASKFIQELRQIGAEKQIKEVAWISSSHIMRGLSSRISTVTGTTNRIPLDKLDISILTGRI